jgi:hypothetical protein
MAVRQHCLLAYRLTTDVPAVSRRGVPVDGIKFDADWVSGYGQLAANSADELGEGVRIMETAPLTDESFGELGRTLRVTEAYASVAGTLREQLSRAVEALGSASTGLEQVTAKYVDADSLTASTIDRQG